MVKTRRYICDRNFKNEEALSMHNAAKHLVQNKETNKNRKILKKIILIGIFLILLALVILGIIAVIPNRTIQSFNINISNQHLNIPLGAVHWHPRLSIKINGEYTKIPMGIGSTIGRVSDTHLSGMGMSPTHTHESDGTIHLENDNPSSKPETLTLGYFFYIWDKQFNSTCIFEYCTDKGTLKMYVNDKENNEFENYIMKDKDNILIVYNPF